MRGFDGTERPGRRVRGVRDGGVAATAPSGLAALPGQPRGGGPRAVRAGQGLRERGRVTREGAYAYVHRTLVNGYIDSVRRRRPVPVDRIGDVVVAGGEASFDDRSELSELPRPSLAPRTQHHRLALLPRRARERGRPTAGRLHGNRQEHRVPRPGPAAFGPQHLRKGPTMTTPHDELDRLLAAEPAAPDPLTSARSGMPAGACGRGAGSSPGSRRWPSSARSASRQPSSHQAGPRPRHPRVRRPRDRRPRVRARRTSRAGVSKTSARTSSPRCAG